MFSTTSKGGTGGEDGDALALLLSLYDICRLRTFLAFGDLELNLIAFLQALIALRGYRAVVHKYVWPISATNEPVSFRVIEPLDGSFQPIHK